MPTAEEQELKTEEQKLNQQVEQKAAEAGQEARKEGLSEEEVKARIEKARKEEKDKLYGQIEEVKAALKEVQKTLREERQEKERIKQEAEQKAEQERQAKLSDTDKTNEILARLEEQLKQERAERLKSEQELKQSQRAEELRRYRENALQAAGDEIISDLVKGNSEEEIDRSVQIAKARYAEYIEKIKSQLGTKVRKGLSQTTNPDTEALEEDELEASLAQVDQDKYMKDPVYREKVKNELASAYMKAMGR